MVEIIREIPGLYFLVVYAIYALIVIYIAKLYLKTDHTRNMEIPEPTKISPIDIALLNRGVKGAIIVSVFNLWKDKKIEIEKNNNNISIKKISVDCIGKNRLESAILRSSSSSRVSYRNLFSLKSLRNANNILSTNRENLVSQGLIVDAKQKQRYWITTFVVIASLLFVGITKFILGVSTDKPVAFLTILMLISIVSAVQLIKPHKLNYTSLGEKFINTSKQRFEWLRKNDNRDLIFDDNILYGIALFGVAIIINTSLGSLLGNPMLLETLTRSGSGYSCSGSSCGGAGCSGGGGCGGGGCGGCGGS